MLSLQIFRDPGMTALLADYTGRVHPEMGGDGLRFSTNQHGFASLEAPLVPMSLDRAFEVYEWPGTPHVAASDGAAGIVWEGRLEDITIVDGGVNLTALGYSRALYDVPYSALWSVTGSADWREVTEDDLAAMQPKRYEMDNNNRVYIAPKKNESFNNQAHVGALTYAVPHLSARGLVRFGCSYSMVLPAGWEFRVISYADDFSGPTVVSTVTASGSTQTGTLDLTLGSVARVVVEIRNNTGGASSITAETGVNYLKLLGIRMKSTAAAAVTASDIAAALVALVRGVNGDQLSASTALIEATATDLQDELYEDELPADILDRLALLHNCEWGVYDGRTLHFRPRGAAGGRQWYVDVTRLTDVQRSLENVRTSAYGVYRDAGGRTRRTAVLDDADSQARHGLTRRGFVSVQTTSLTEAQTHRGVWLSDRATMAIRAQVEFDRLYDAAGARWPLWAARAGDTITMRNLSPTLSTAIDRIRKFRIGETEYDAGANTLSVAPDDPTPTLVTLVARRGAGL